MDTSLYSNEIKSSRYNFVNNIKDRVMAVVKSHLARRGEDLIWLGILDDALAGEREAATDTATIKASLLLAVNILRRVNQPKRIFPNYLVQCLVTSGTL